MQYGNKGVCLCSNRTFFTKRGLWQAMVYKPLRLTTTIANTLSISNSSLVWGIKNPTADMESESWLRLYRLGDLQRIKAPKRFHSALPGDPKDKGLSDGVWHLTSCTQGSPGPQRHKFTQDPQMRKWTGARWRREVSIFILQSEFFSLSAFEYLSPKFK